MKTAIDYPITFKFGGVWYPYYTKTPNPDRLYTSHHGEDRGMPTGTQVVVSGKTIGLSGNTGLSAAPHLHVDEKKIGANPAVRANFKNPNGWSTITGKVVFAGSAGTAGNMITIHTDKGLEYRFLHLSKINVKVGDKIGEDMVEKINAIYNKFKEI